MFTFFGCPRVSSGNHPNDPRRPKNQKNMCEKFPRENKKRPKTDLGSQDVGSKDPRFQGTKITRKGKKRREEKRKVKKREEESIPTKN